MANTDIEGWRKFWYSVPYAALPMAVSLKWPKDAHYRLRLPQALSCVVRTPLYDYRYVQEFAQIIGFFNAVIASSKDPYLSSLVESGNGTHLEHICSFVNERVNLDFDYDELSKELWDDQYPDLLCDPKLWEVYKETKSRVMQNFKNVIESYRRWSADHTDLSFQEFVTAFNDFLEVK